MTQAAINYIRYFCGENGVGGIDDEFCSRIREKLYKLTNRLIRAYAEIKGEMDSAGYSVAEQAEQSDIDKKVAFYAALKETIGNTNGDFIGLKSYEADMRRLIDTYIKAEDRRKIGEFNDFTLLDFVLAQGENLGGKGKEAAAEAIENNIRKKVVEKILINPKYYESMSAILDELIKARRESAIEYEELLAKYIELIKRVENPENNPRYPTSIRRSGALRAFYDNYGENEELALAIDKAVRESKQADFRHNEFKGRRIKQALLKVLNDTDKVEHVYNIVVEQSMFGARNTILQTEYGNKNKLVLSGDRALLTIRKESAAKQRENFVREWYRSLLKAEIVRLLPKWEKATGLKTSSWQTKYMTTRWRTCNSKTRKIWLNLQLAKKTPECLEYIILHELAHLVEKKHNKRFSSLMDKYMPMWRDIKTTLNGQSLDYME
ncbi:MAG: M48 family metallopeptidase [Endomicrobium sp.]|nr:M48 family metallopeptidase [Endomicrobium sp.]